MIIHQSVTGRKNGFADRQEVEDFFGRQIGEAVPRAEAAAYFAGQAPEGYFAQDEDTPLGRLSATINAWSAFGLICMGLGMLLGAGAYALIVG